MKSNIYKIKIHSNLLKKLLQRNLSKFKYKFLNMFRVLKKLFKFLNISIILQLLKKLKGEEKEQNGQKQSQRKKDREIGKCKKIIRFQQLLKSQCTYKSLFIQKSQFMLIDQLKNKKLKRFQQKFLTKSPYILTNRLSMSK